MAKTVFRPTEITKSEEKVMLKLSRNYAPEVEEEVIEEVPEYQGPTADDLRREAEMFKAEWEVEKQKLLDSTQEEAEKIIKNAEQAAFEEVKRKTDQSKTIKAEAELQAQRIIKEAELKALEIQQETEKNRDKVVSDAYKEGFSKGSEEGYTSGKNEVQRLTDRLHTILERTLDRRQEILDETEQQIVELVLLMTRKVVKVISESQRNVVMTNIVQALRKVKGRGDVTIRVNLSDVQLATDHIKEFMSSVENIKNITVVEDTTVERGGCVIETDFGAIDARISSQLSELEQKILEISPIKTITKTTAINPDF
ncbi:MAG TPA: flagellar assembly protein FliH [Treponemataceae bacterium]|nr:flagellar assembly protein FliH [Treponemataceae bacterium]